MKISTCLSSLLACVLLSGCGGDGNGTHVADPGPAAMKVDSNNIPMRAGDKITIQLSGVPDGDYFNQVLIPASGDITLPLLNQPIHAVGYNPAELSVIIVNAYKSQKLYTDPIVSIFPDERYVIVEGDVRSPSNVVWRPNSTLLSIINNSGGFSDYADRRHVRIIRGQQILHFDCIQALQSLGDDPPVYPDDRIFVPRTMF